MRKQFTIKNSSSGARAYRNFALGLFSFLAAFIVASTFAPVRNSEASTVEITNNTTDYYIRLTSADTLPLAVEASPTGQLAIAADTLNVITNSPNGYKLYVSTSGNDNNIYQGGSSANSAQGYFYPTTGNIETPAALTQNTWGFALAKVTDTAAAKYNPLAATFADITEYINNTGAPTTNSTWAGVPTFANSSTAKISEYSVSNSPDGSTFDIYYGINASTTLPSGTYSTEITYTAISEGVNRFPTMQEFTAEQCYNMATDTSINLTDSRDDKYYRVTKMKDGHCWMTDNLALDGTDAAGNVRVLTPSDSNVTTNRPLAENIENGTASEYDVVQIYSGVADEVTSECDTSYEYCVENTSTKYGNLYNWFAATARSGTETTTTTAAESICPKGWQLPDSNGVYSYPNLLLHYGLPTENTTDTDAVKAIQQAPFYFALGGRYHDAPVYQGRLSTYWTNTPNGTSSHYSYVMHLNTETGVFNPYDNNGNKPYGFSVRCVFSGQSTDPTMQEFTTAQCNALAKDASQVLIDRRNNQFYKIVKAIGNAGDSNSECWMADNLSIYNQTIAATDSDFTSGTYTIPAGITQTSEWTSNIYNKPMVEISHGLGNNATTNSDYYGQVFYNWCAATATTSTACATTSAPNTSICPNNWTLPANGNSSTVKTWAHLLENVTGGPITTSAQLIENQYLGLTKYYGYWNWYNDSESYQGSNGTFWISTPSSGTTAYYLAYGYNSGAVSPQHSDGKGHGFSVRCVHR